VETGVTLKTPDVAPAPLHAPDAVHAVAFVDDQVNVEDCPWFIDCGAAEIITVGGLLILTVVVAVADPVEFVAVSIYVVVVIGLTDLEVPVTVPIPWFIDKDVALDTFQLKVEEDPELIFDGEAVNDVIVGSAEGGGGGVGFTLPANLT
jgi:hypothetical protein